MSGVALLGTAVGWMSVSVPAGKWILKHGYRKLLLIGNVLLLIGNVLLVGSGTLLLMLNESHGFFYVFCVMIVQGLSFGLLSTVGVIGVQQLVGGHERGISTSFLCFAETWEQPSALRLWVRCSLQAEASWQAFITCFIWLCRKHRGVINVVKDSKRYGNKAQSSC